MSATHDERPPLSPPDIAYLKHALALVTAGREGRDAFEAAYSDLLLEVQYDETHPLHGVYEPRLLAFAMVLLVDGLSDLVVEAVPDEPLIIDGWLSVCGKQLATWPVLTETD